MRYVVTGAAGFIGSHLAEALLADGHEVVGWDAFTDYYDPSLKEENARGLDVRRVDLATDELDVSGVDGVFHLAGQPGVRSFGDVFDVYVRENVLAGRRLFEAAARDGVRVVYSSTSSIYGAAETFPTPEETQPRPLSPYGVTKLAAEHLAFAYARGFGLDAVVLRYFSVFGPRQRPDMAFPRIVAALLDATPFELYGDGGHSRGFTYVDDVVTATVAAMERAPAGAVYNVGGGAEVSMLEAIAAFEELAGRPLDLRMTGTVPGDQRRSRADTSRIEAELGWRPVTAFEQGIHAQWDWAAGRVGAR